jgi:hypothetical protein
MTTIDPDELLRSANPVDEARLLAPSESAAAQRLFEKITGVGYAPRPPLPQRRRWRVYLTSVAAAIAVGSGVAYAVTYRQPTKRLDVDCFAQASLTGRSAGLPSDGRDPVAVCRDAWLAGRVVPGGHTAPDLVGCILSTGIAGVFPEFPITGNPGAAVDDVCHRLGLAAMAVAPATAPPSIPAVIGLRDRLVLAFKGKCLDATQAQAIVQRELRRAGLAGWTVMATTPLSPDRPCASLGFDEPARMVLIIPNTPTRSG